MDDIVSRARALATTAHHGQTDKAGQPYITHPERVAALAAPDPLTQATAWLHDIIEDTLITEEDLQTHGFPTPVIEAVSALTKREHQSREDYYTAVRTNPLALAVKLADLADNTDPSRLAALDPATRERLEGKYARAREALLDV